MVSKSMIQRLTYSTSLIESLDKYNYQYKASSFFYFLTLENEKVPVLVTNRHVVRDKVIMHATISQVSADNTPVLGNYFNLDINCGSDKTIYKHPNDNIDLAVIDLRPYLQKLPQNKYFSDFLNQTEIITAGDLKRMHAMQEIIMIGYPNGIFDGVHKLPVFRKGIAATNPAVDYNGEKCFLIDTSCFPGSSGSPVFSYENDTLGVDAEGYLTSFSGFHLMGILSAGYQNSVMGQVIDSRGVVKLDMPNNLGIVIKASCLDDFKVFFI